MALPLTKAKLRRQWTEVADRFSQVDLVSYMSGASARKAVIRHWLHPLTPRAQRDGVYHNSFIFAHKAAGCYFPFAS